MASNITLSAGVRQNLLSLQGTADLMSSTQNRLATGKKVNSALDNPTNFFTASSLQSRAGDMSSLLDSMSNGIKTLEAADNGLSSITDSLESMQSTLRQASQDKSFQTASFSVKDSLTSGSLTFDGGAVGTVGRSVELANTALTATALGMNAAVAEDAGTAATASTVTGVGDADLAVGEGGTITVTVGGDDYDVILTDTDTMETAADKINDAVGSDVTDGSGAQMVLTNADGSGISVADATGNGAGTTDALFGATPTVVAGVEGTAGVNTFTWPDEAVEVNQNAKISFTATIDGKDQTIAIAHDDVLTAGNDDGIIDDAAEFATILNSKIEGATASAAGNAISITSNTFGTASTVELSAATVSGIAYTADELVQSINESADLNSYIRASNDDGKLRIENLSTQKLNVTGASAGEITGTTIAKSEIAGNSVRAGLADQFNELRDQLDKLADDASFNGINLLRGDNLKLTFNETGTSSIEIQTKDAEAINSSSLGLNNIEAEDLDSDTNIDALLDKVKSALGEIRSQSSSFGSNLSVVENRTQFTKSMVNTLQTGADALVLADTNEEAANMLALQTRQQLSSTALSMASQADQAVLRLF